MAAARWAGLRAQAGRGGAAIAFVGSAAFAGGASVCSACLPAADATGGAGDPSAASSASAGHWVWDAGCSSPKPIHELTIQELGDAMSTGRLTAAAVVANFKARIAGATELNAVNELNPDAEKIAAELDAERAAGHVRGPMHGICVLLKENVDTGDAMATTAGSLALLSSHPAGDATIAANLRAAGAVILGKTNLSEWANFRSTSSRSGWSARGGQCRNPHVLDRSPCGSSAGSGSAIGASLATVAVGTETDGSIVCPATVCGIVGFKPTVGLVSRAGIVPISHSQDTAGPMAHSVADCAALLDAMTGSDPKDAATLGCDGKRPF